MEKEQETICIEVPEIIAENKKTSCLLKSNFTTHTMYSNYEIDVYESCFIVMEECLCFEAELKL